MTEKILLVDDEKGIRTVLGITLADYGYEVLTASSGGEALTTFRNQKPAIVLTDIKMPGMDGIQVLRKIKEESPDTQVIMITGHGDLELAIQSLKCDATDFITKPINDDALEIALKRANEKIFFKGKMKEYTENLERLVAEKTKELLATERLATVGQTVAGLAHAIKNVVSGLKGGAFVLEKGIQLDNQKYLMEGWEMIKGNLGKIGNMTLDLLNYSKERVPEYQRCDLNQPAREVFDLMVREARRRGVTLGKNLDEQLSEGWLDPDGIHRCILNLVSNAIDACTDISCVHGKGEVTIKTRKADGWAVVYEVVDNGCGMDTETRSKIFEQFFSTKGSRGTGLGLMITKKIIAEHGGKISCESQKGKGTRFIFRLPEKENPSDTEIC
ncbi:MAG: hybrid sensor histidine kinase/response regulator [Deltaproteobacteria bacterium]|nr:hybrid sensor histidine kinase/response regulator [Deltaproteobacteria bacterium]